MKKFHNPMTIPLLIIFAVMIFGFICFLFFSGYDGPAFLYVIIVVIYLLISGIVLWQDYSNKKSHAKTDPYCSVTEYVTKEIEISKIIIIVAITLAVIFGLVALFMYDANIGLTFLFPFCFILFFVLIYLNMGKSTEHYRASKNKRTRLLLEKIHELILTSDSAISCDMNPLFNFPTYTYFISMDISVWVMSVRAISKNICIYPHNVNVFDVFANRLKNYTVNGQSEILFPLDKAIDFDLIKDILTYNIQTRL